MVRTRHTWHSPDRIASYKRSLSSIRGFAPKASPSTPSHQTPTPTEISCETLPANAIPLCAVLCHHRIAAAEWFHEPVGSHDTALVHRIKTGCRPFGKLWTQSLLVHHWQTTLVCRHFRRQFGRIRIFRRPRSNDHDNASMVGTYSLTSLIETNDHAGSMNWPIPGAMIPWCMASTLAGSGSITMTPKSARWPLVQ